MVKYKVNLKFKENGKSLDDIITNVLKIELEKHTNMNCNILNKEILLKHNNYFQSEKSID